MDSYLHAPIIRWSQSRMKSRYFCCHYKIKTQIVIYTLYKYSTLTFSQGRLELLVFFQDKKLIEIISPKSNLN